MYKCKKGFDAHVPSASIAYAWFMSVSSMFDVSCIRRRPSFYEEYE
jgi:hypothetical protein